jgi:hypothetical protein
MPASHDNSDGFWENLAFVRLNERLLAASGGSWYSPPVRLVATPQLTAEATALLRQFDGHEPSGWKDPRNAITLPFWESLLPMKVLMCVRHPAETAASLVASAFIPRAWRFYWGVTRVDSPLRLGEGNPGFARRLWRAIRLTMSVPERRALVYEVGLELWRIYNTTLLAETRAGERLVVHYEALLRNPRLELDRINEFAGTHVPPERLDEIAHTVAPQMRHQRADDSTLPRDLASLYAELLALSAAS